MTDRTKRALLIAIAAVVVALMALFVARNWDDFRQLELAAPLLLIPLAAAAAVNLFSNGWLMASILRPLGVALNRSEAFSLSVLNRLGNYVAPFRLGASVRIVYLKNNYDLPVTRFLASMTATYVIQYGISSLAGVGALLWLTAAGDTDWNVVGWGFVAAVIGLGLLVAWTPRHPEAAEGEGRIRRILRRFVEGWATIRAGRGDLALAAWWALATYGSFAFMTFFEFRVLGVEISPMEAAFVTSVGALTGLIGITPAGLGIAEGLVVLAASTIGLPVHVAFAAAMLQRVVVFLLVGVLSPYTSAVLARRGKAKLSGGGVAG